MIIRVQQQDFDIAEVNSALIANRRDVGAIASFVGLVRDMSDGELQSMTLEHYSGMTEKALEKIIEKARQRWQIIDCAIIHRVGELHPSDQIVLVSVVSAHRREAFAACEFIMDFLKTEAPFWKKETGHQGSQWVEAKTSDDEARDRWQAK